MSTKVVLDILRSLSPFQILIFENFEPQIVGHGHGVHFSQCNKCKNLQNTPTHFRTSSHCFRDINMLNFLPSKK